LNTTPKVLVCITPQSNSHRLIQKAAAIAEEKQGELNVLHIEKGSNVFATKESPKLLQTLFEYSAQFGGTCHAVCGEDVPAAMVAFMKSERIACVVFGEPPVGQAGVPAIVETVQMALPQLEMRMIPRE